MHPGGENDYFLVLFESVRASTWIFLSFRIQAALIMGCVRRYGLPLIKYAITRGQRHHLHFPTFDGVVNGLPVEVEVLLGRCRLKLLLNLVYFGLGLLVAEWVRESEERRLIRLGAEHVLEP